MGGYFTAALASAFARCACAWALALWAWALLLFTDLLGSLEPAALTLSPASFVDSATAFPVSFAAGTAWEKAATAKVVVKIVVTSIGIFTASPSGSAHYGVQVHAHERLANVISSIPLLQLLRAESIAAADLTC